jgi:methylmalonyl-CoA mutase
MSHSLFSEFSPTTFEEWKAIVLKDLKGADYDKSLLKSSDEGIVIDALYNQESVSIQHQEIGNFPYTRGAKQDNAWKINEDIYFSSAKEGNTKALKALAGGANSVSFYGEIASAQDAEILLKDVMLDIIDSYYSCSETSCTFISEYFEKHYSKINLTGGFLLEDERKTSLYESPLFSHYNINGYEFNLKGATAVEELAFTLAKGNEMIKQLITNNSIDEVCATIKFTLGTSPNYFLEIAKIRAFRALWANVVKAYQPKYSCSQIAFIHSKTSAFYHAGIDLNTNILRNTTQAMSSILGGCNTLSVTPHNLDYNNDFSLRIARNIQLIIQEESYFNKVADPSGGAYFIEYLSDELCAKAWKLFQDIEAKGGFSTFEKSGELTAMLTESLQKKQNAVETNIKHIIGVNKHPVKNETQHLTQNIERLTSSFEKKQLVS